MADSWGARTAQRLKEQDEQGRLQQATELREQELIKHRAFPLWHELKEKLQEMATDFNEQYGRSYLMALPGGTANSMFIQSPKRKVEMRFDNIMPEVSFSPSFERMGNLRFGVENGEVLFVWDGPRFSVDTTAQTILDRFV